MTPQMEVYSECEEAHSCFAEKGGGFPLAAKGKYPGQQPPWGVHISTHISVENPCIQETRANAAAPPFPIFP